MLSAKNMFPLYSSLQNVIPCPDTFMHTKVLLHKAEDWKHEREWRLTFQCNSPERNQQEFSYAIKQPTAVYLGRKFSPIYEKILCQIAAKKIFQFIKCRFGQKIHHINYILKNVDT